MGRVREYRQRLKYQLFSVGEKSLINQIKVELQGNFGLSQTEAELLAQLIETNLFHEKHIRTANQILLKGTPGRLTFSRSKRTKSQEIIITPFDFKDLEVEWEFGLKKMQENRLLRIIEEAYEQNSLLSKKDLCILLNITTNSISQRLRKLRAMGFRAETSGVEKSQRTNNSQFRSTWLLQKYFEGSDIYQSRETAAVSKTHFREIIHRFKIVLREAHSGAFEGKSLEEKEWVNLSQKIPEKKLLDFSVTELLPKEDFAQSRFQQQLKSDFGYSPVVIRAIEDFKLELKNQIINDREPTQVIYWAVASEEPAGKPLSACRLVAVPVTLLSEEEISLKGEIKRLKEIKLAKIIRYSNEAKIAGGFLNQSDLSFILGIHSDAVRRLIKENNNMPIPLRGSECDIGRGLSHRVKILELYLQMYTETEIVDRTGHSYASVENYIKEFATVFALKEKGLPAGMIRKVTGRSLNLIKIYLDLIQKYSAPDFSLRFMQLRRVFLKEERKTQKRGAQLR